MIPGALRSGPRGTRFDPIPKILHQTWKTDQIPDAWRGYQESWQRAHPEWEYRLWTDEANRRLIAERHAWFLPAYDGFPRHIQRVDAAKYFILYTHGGVYADLDCECVQPLDSIISQGGAVVGRTRDGVIECATLASPRGHPLWEGAFREMQAIRLGARVLRGVPGFEASYVLLSTGPRMMTRVVRQYVATLPAGDVDVAAITILAPACFSSRSWLDRHEPFRREPSVFVRHQYSDSWLMPGEKGVVKWFTRRRLRWAAVVILLAGLMFVAAR